MDVFFCFDEIFCFFNFLHFCCHLLFLLTIFSCWTIKGKYTNVSATRLSSSVEFVLVSVQQKWFVVGESHVFFLWIVFIVNHLFSAVNQLAFFVFNRKSFVFFFVNQLFLIFSCFQDCFLFLFYTVIGFMLLIHLFFLLLT